MIAESSFAAVFGAPVPGGEDSLVHLARAAVRAGFAVVPCLPGTKQPMCTLPARDVRRADELAQEHARLEGRPRWSRIRHACGLKHAITDEKASDRIIRRLVRDYGRINLGVELSASRAIVVDVDTDAEKEAFAASWMEATGSPLPFGMTVTSPGVYDTAAETWKHKNGGHYWFALPEGLELPSGDDGAMKDPSGWIAMWAARQVMVPPSVRKEGVYLLTGDIHPAPEWLLERIVEFVISRRGRARAQGARVAARIAGQDPHIDTWAAETPWADLLEPDGWYDTGLPDTCGCVIWTAPGPHASPKSATAHDVGCTNYDDAPGHCPLHVWTDNPPEFLINTQFSDKTFTKIQYVALRDHAGDIQQACRAEGIAREVAPLVALPGVPASVGGPLVAQTPSFVVNGAPIEMGHSEQLPSNEGRGPAAGTRWEDSTGVGWTPPDTATREEAVSAGLHVAGTPPEYETWAVEHEDQLGPDELADLGYERPKLVGLPAPTGEGAPAPVVDPYDPFEQLVRSDLQRLVVRAEAEKRWTEIRYPYAARTAARGMQPMRDVVKAAAEAPAEFLVEDWIRAGSYGVLGAEYKAGKTFLVLDMAVSIISGGMFLGIVPCKVGRVAMMHNEGDSKEFVDRLRAVAAFKRIELTDEMLDRLLFQEGATRLDQPDEVGRLYENLEGFRPDLLTLDPWYMSAGAEADGKTLSKMGTVLGNLQGVAQEVGTALLVTTHWNQTGTGKGVSRWSGAGLAEWGRFLINVAVDKFVPARPYAEDQTRKTTTDLTVTLMGQVAGTYTVHREVWRDDARDLATPMRYVISAREAEDELSPTAEIERDVTMSERERLLRAFIISTAGLTKTKAIETAKGSKSRGRALRVWNEAFDELLNDGAIEDLGAELDATNAAGQQRPVGYAKFGITKRGQTEVERLDELRTRVSSTTRFVGISPPTTEKS